MRLITYRLVVTAPDSVTPDLLERYVEDALEGLSREDGIESRYVQIGTAEGLPDKAPEARGPVQPAGLPQGVYREGADL
jgi:hypothetical protein